MAAAEESKGPARRAGPVFTKIAKTVGVARFHLKDVDNDRLRSTKIDDQIRTRITADDQWYTNLENPILLAMEKVLDLAKKKGSRENKIRHIIHCLNLVATIQLDFDYPVVPGQPPRSTRYDMLFRKEHDHEFLSTTLTDKNSLARVEFVYQLVICRATHPLFPSPITGAVFRALGSNIFPDRPSKKIPGLLTEKIGKGLINDYVLSFIKTYSTEEPFAQPVGATGIKAAKDTSGRPSWTADIENTLYSFPDSRFDPQNIGVEQYWEAGLKLVKASPNLAVPATVDKTWYKGVYFPNVGPIFGVQPVLPSEQEEVDYQSEVGGASNMKDMIVKMRTFLTARQNNSFIINFVTYSAVSDPSVDDIQ